MKLVPLLAALALASPGCRKSAVSGSGTPHTLAAGTFITSAGTYADRSGRSLTVKLGGGRITCDFSREETGKGICTDHSGASLTRPADPWFVFVESPVKHWIFDGVDSLQYQVYHKGGGSNGGIAFYGGAIEERVAIPPGVVARLPAELQELLPPVEAPVERPSF